MAIYKDDRYKNPERNRKISESQKKRWNSMSKEDKKTRLDKTHNKLKGTSPWNKGLKSMIFGARHWNWKGGITKENHLLRTSLEYDIFRKTVFERDNYLCQKCGKIGGKLIVHHIKPFALKKDMFSTKNGITLCKTDHQTFHKTYGYKDIGRAELLNFLSE